MKPFKYLITIAALAIGLTLSAKADLLYEGAVDFSLQPNNNPSSNLAALEANVSGVPTDLTLQLNVENANGIAQTIAVDTGCYLVVHYGSQGGGSLEFFLVENGETSVTVPASPFNGTASGDVRNTNNLGADTFATNANSLSSIREFCPPGTNIPDSGSTLMLLGAVLGAGEVLRRTFAKRSAAVSCNI